MEGARKLCMRTSREKSFEKSQNLFNVFFYEKIIEKISLHKPWYCQKIKISLDIEYWVLSQL